jgi:formyltetrahydrofolate-dependent phosphoribosylglycinamide formyltransferase
MFEGLQKKWKVSGFQLILILSTFAIGGSLTGFVGKKIMNALQIQQDWLWTLFYIVLVTILWPLSVLIVSIPFGQFRFFNRYIHRIGGKIGLIKVSDPGGRPQTKIAIFASGAGTNAECIIDYFRDHPGIKVALIITNNPLAGVIKIAKKENLDYRIIEKARFFSGDHYIPLLTSAQIGFIVLAGFLWKLPPDLVSKYAGRIINIHPALLPKHGGRGMYGHHVHRAVLNSGEKQSGITVHFVDEVYDNGKIIFQATCPVFDQDTVESLTSRIHTLEHEHYPRVIEEVIGHL